MSKKNDVNKCPRVDIGGQAVMEGVMMRSPKHQAVTVRRADGTLVTKVEKLHLPGDKHPWMKKPFIRGTVSMITMLTSGMKTLEDSTKMLGIMDEEPTQFEKWLSEKLHKGIDKIVMFVAIVMAVILSVGLFIAIPAGIETLLKNAGMSAFGYTLLGGVVKILILIGYMAFCGSIPDVRRTFQYHGAEHKSVFCHEAQEPLTPANAMKYSCLHPRCGTAFLLIVFTISILLFLVLNVLMPISNYFLRLLFHLAMLPIVAGVSYEVLKGLAHSESKAAKLLRWPGLQMQRLTTREPDESMLECAIVSMNLALTGELPAHAPRTPEGWAILHSYAESEPGYVPRSETENTEIASEEDGSEG
ncbi:MAG: DUF1385 domain-containing protein [Clostridia bacterium]|nr:DUF1385 domain-containing protein [Clostridia bacterium]